ncbi:hypothetical protein QTH14_07355 [Clostridium perfringens]|uniref:hypothetical protein n=1 Tax=Clostridium perfringens TaxID=1502 RepID=UPI001A318211|nr:hypothetical protein [Clostridium perfringens]MDK0728150.1 hypothetical protein [Clostridium perfringens]MDM0565677.1 hypothetical protein [Clostridium perfringens]MDM0574874.1 hypothetical protein [Clostridium perfringens]HAT4266767.1 hypothetical protein [Clostridium perfringens]
MDYNIDNEVLKLSLVSVPNGQLYNIFGDSIINAGKVQQIILEKILDFWLIK